MTTAELALALILVGGQGAIIGLLMYFVRTFRGYTQVLLQVHESNILLREKTVELLDRVLEVRRDLGNVA